MSKTLYAEGKVESVKIRCVGDAETEIVLQVGCNRTSIVRQEAEGTYERLTVFVKTTLPISKGDLIRIRYQEKNGVVKELQRVRWNDGEILYSYQDYL